MKDIGLALNMYAGDNQEWFPYPSDALFNPVFANSRRATTAYLALLYPEYESDFLVFVCPSSDEKPYSSTGNVYTDRYNFINNGSPTGPHLSYGMQINPRLVESAGAVQEGISQMHINMTGTTVAMLIDRAKTNAASFADNNHFWMQRIRFPAGTGPWYVQFHNDTSDNPRTSQPNHGVNEGTNIAYSDGSAKWVSFEFLETFESNSNRRERWGLPVEDVPTLGQYYGGTLGGCTTIGSCLLSSTCCTGFYGMGQPYQ